MLALAAQQGAPLTGAIRFRVRVWHPGPEEEVLGLGGMRRRHVAQAFFGSGSASSDKSPGLGRSVWGG